MPKDSDNARRLPCRAEDFLVLPARRAEFVALKDWLNAIADALKIAEKTRKQILIAADEVFTNVASYAYPSGGGEIKIKANVIEKNDSDAAKSRVLALIFSDSGVPFNPLETPPPDFLQLADERTIGGLGIFMTRQLMDSVEYCRENNFNILTLKKAFSDVAE